MALTTQTRDDDMTVREADDDLVIQDMRHSDLSHLFQLFIAQLLCFPCERCNDWH